MNNQNNNNGCGCNCPPQPAPVPPVDINMSVCDRNINMLPMLQTYTTKVLKPNICCKKNILTQEMMNCEGYKYVIKWKYDLNGQTITVPENCILEFDGGSLRNGTIVGQDTLFINVGDVKIWEDNLVRLGTWREYSGAGGGGGIPDKEYDPEHFSGLGRKTLNLKDGSNILTQDDFDKDHTIYVFAYDFILGEDVTIPDNSILLFDGGSLNGQYNGVNHVITGQETIIESNRERIFENLTFDGTIIGDLVLNHFIHSRDCVESRKNLNCAIHVIGNCVIDEPLLVESYFSIYGDGEPYTSIILNPEYSGQIKTLFLFDSVDALVQKINFRDFSAKNIDYVFYMYRDDITSGGVMIADFKNLYFSNIGISAFYFHCSFFGCANIINVSFYGTTSGALIDCYNLWFNDNTIERCRCQGNNGGFLKVRAINGSEIAQITHNNLINNYIEKVALNSGIDYLIDLQCEYSTYDLNIQDNYIEKICKGSLSGPLASLFRIYDTQKTRKVNFDSNCIVGHFSEDYNAMNGNLFVFNAVDWLNISNNGVYGMNLKVKARMTIEATACNNSCILAYEGYIDEWNTEHINIQNLYGINDLKTFAARLNYLNTVTKVLAGGASFDVYLKPETTKSIFWSDVEITWIRNDVLHHVFGKLVQLYDTTEFINLTPEETDITIVTSENQEFQDTSRCPVTITNTTDTGIEMKLGVVMMTYNNPIIR